MLPEDELAAEAAPNPDVELPNPEALLPNPALGFENPRPALPNPDVVGLDAVLPPNVKAPFAEGFDAEVEPNRKFAGLAG